MDRRAARLLVAALLGIAAAVCLLELSGRWDQSLQDGNDEAAFVGIVLCVGAACSVAAAMVERAGAIRPLRSWFVSSPFLNGTDAPALARIPANRGGPPLATLRI